MEETMIIRPFPGTEGLTVRTLRVFKVIARELDGRTGRVDYQFVADELGIEWNNVKYAVQALVRAEVLQKEDGKLTVLKKLVL